MPLAVNARVSAAVVTHRPSDWLSSTLRRSAPARVRSGAKASARSVAARRELRRDSASAAWASGDEDDRGGGFVEASRHGFGALATGEEDALVLRDRLGTLAGVDGDAVKGGLAAEPRGEGGFDRDIHAAPPGDMVARYSPGELVSET